MFFFNRQMQYTNECLFSINQCNTQTEWINSIHKWVISLLNHCDIPRFLSQSQTWLLLRPSPGRHLTFNWCQLALRGPIISLWVMPVSARQHKSFHWRQTPLAQSSASRNVLTWDPFPVITVPVICVHSSGKVRDLPRDLWFSSSCLLSWLLQ